MILNIYRFVEYVIRPYFPPKLPVKHLAFKTITVHLVLDFVLQPDPDTKIAHLPLPSHLYFA